jgi:hypothetical protein
VVVSLVHTSLGSSYLIAHVLHSPPPPRAQLCKRSCSNKHTHTPSELLQTPISNPYASDTLTIRTFLFSPRSLVPPPDPHAWRVSASPFSKSLQTDFCKKWLSMKMNLVFSLLLHVLGPKFERRQRPRNSQKSSGQGGAGET